VDYPPRAVAIGDQPNPDWSGWNAVDRAVHNLQTLRGKRPGIGVAGSADDEDDVDDDHATGFDEIGLQGRLRKAIAGVLVDASQLDEKLPAPVTHRVNGLDRRVELLSAVVGSPEREVPAGGASLHVDEDALLGAEPLVHGDGVARRALDVSAVGLPAGVVEAVTSASHRLGRRLGRRGQPAVCALHIGARSELR